MKKRGEGGGEREATIDYLKKGPKKESPLFRTDVLGMGINLMNEMLNGSTYKNVA